MKKIMSVEGGTCKHLRTKPIILSDMPRPSKKGGRRNKIIWFLRQHPGLSNIRTIANSLNIPYASCHELIHDLASAGEVRLQTMNNGLFVLVSLMEEL